MPLLEAFVDTPLYIAANFSKRNLTWLQLSRSITHNQDAVTHLILLSN